SSSLAGSWVLRSRLASDAAPERSPSLAERWLSASVPRLRFASLSEPRDCLRSLGVMRKQRPSGQGAPAGSIVRVSMEPALLPFAVRARGAHDEGHGFPRTAPRPFERQADAADRASARCGGARYPLMHLRLGPAPLSRLCA